jgi:RNA recognition motif-containing protein
MVATLYFGNLSWNTSDADLQQLVSAHTQVYAARVATDRESGRSRGFGFVEVPVDAAEAVITALHKTLLDGRPITVNHANPRTGGGDGPGHEARGGRGHARTGYRAAHQPRGFERV